MSHDSSRHLSIVKPSNVNIRTAWPSEPYDFTPWLSENLDVLSVLDIGRLMTAQTEVSLPGTSRSLDILAELDDGTFVAIENQFGRADHDHLTRGLAYAIGLNSSEKRISALVVIAEDHATEFVAIADYLNNAAERLGDDGIPVFLVSVQVEQVTNVLVPRFSVISRPNEWRAQASASVFLQSVDEFRRMLEADTQVLLDDLVKRWNAREGTRIDHKAKRAIAFYMTNRSAKRGETAVFVVWSDGTLVINIGYLESSGALSVDDADELRKIVTSKFPATVTGKKEYYYSTRFTDVDLVIEVADWINSRIGHS